MSLRRLVAVARRHDYELALIIDIEGDRSRDVRSEQCTQGDFENIAHPHGAKGRMVIEDAEIEMVLAGEAWI